MLALAAWTSPQSLRDDGSLLSLPQCCPCKLQTSSVCFIVFLESVHDDSEGALV